MEVLRLCLINAVYNSLINSISASKGSKFYIIYILFAITVAEVVPCGSPKKSPYIIHSADYIFHQLLNIHLRIPGVVLKVEKFSVTFISQIFYFQMISEFDSNYP